MYLEKQAWVTRQRQFRAYREQGLWSGRTTADYANERAAATPDAVAIVDGVNRLSYKQLLQEAQRIASGLRDLGLQKGDVISFQLPNWWESVVVNLAAALGGWIVNPIVPIYRDAEISHILEDCQAKVMFIPTQFRSINYLEMMQNLKRKVLKQDVQIITVRGNQESQPGILTFETLGQNSTPWINQKNSADDVKLILYTSGTTGRAKGVLHSSNTLLAELQAVTDFWEVTANDVMFMPSPVTHITGYSYALEYSFFRGVKVVLMDRWNVAQAVKLIESEGATLTVGATPFLSELVREVEDSGTQIPLFRLFASGGAPVPPELILRASQVLPDCVVCRVYGSSEVPTVSLGVNRLGEVEHAAYTDGRIYNNDVRVLHPETGEELAAGIEGEIAVTGPEVMLGYLHESDSLDAFNAEGYFLTGDLGFVSEGQFITITGRKKDIIIRGGENLSSKEIEDLLHEHPDVLEAAVVGMPHPRLGETPCAYLILRKNASMTFEDLIAYLDTKKLARQKLPEHLVVVDEMPKTASGKIQKHILRVQIAEYVTATAPLGKAG